MNRSMKYHVEEFLMKWEIFMSEKQQSIMSDCVSTMVAIKRKNVSKKKKRKEIPKHVTHGIAGELTFLLYIFLCSLPILRSEPSE